MKKISSSIDEESLIAVWYNPELNSLELDHAATFHYWMSHGYDFIGWFE